MKVDIIFKRCSKWFAENSAKNLFENERETFDTMIEQITEEMKTELYNDLNDYIMNVFEYDNFSSL